MTGEMIYMMVDMDTWDIDVCMGDGYMLGESYTKDNLTDRTLVYYVYLCIPSYWDGWIHIPSPPPGVYHKMKDVEDGCIIMGHDCKDG